MKKYVLRLVAAVLCGLLLCSTAAALPFTDVGEDDDLYESVQYLWENGIVSGTEETRFDAELPILRAELTVMLWRLEGCPVVNYLMRFTDVQQAEWYAEAVRWAAAEKLVSGHGDDTFAPMDAITRAELAAMLYRYVQYKGGGFKDMWMFLLRYDDVADIPEWAYESFCWLTMNDIYLRPTDTTLVPQGDVTRGEAAEMLYRMINCLKTA